MEQERRRELRYQQIANRRIEGIQEDMEAAAALAGVPAINPVFHMNYLGTVPEFGGEAHDLPEYIRASEILINQYGRNADPFFQQILLSGLRTKLIGRARIITSGREINTWPELKNILQSTFADQRNEESLLQDLTSLRQHNDTPQVFYERCQRTRSLLFARLSLTEANAQIRHIKQTLYDSLALKAFVSGLKEPLGSNIRARMPQTMEIAMGHVIDEENVSYYKGQPNHLLKPTQKQLFTSRQPNYNQQPNRANFQQMRPPQQQWIPYTQNYHPQTNHYQRQFQPPFTPRNLNQRPGYQGQWNPPRNVWQNPSARVATRPTPMDTSSRQIATRPTPMDTSSRQTAFQRTPTIRQSSQPRNFVAEELFYQEEPEVQHDEDIEAEYDFETDNYEDNYEDYEQDFLMDPEEQSKT